MFLIDSVEVELVVIVAKILGRFFVSDERKEKESNDQLDLPLKERVQ
jgi:hypothetical protein